MLLRQYEAVRCEFNTLKTDMAQHRPTMFIGSSVEGLQIAEAIQINLDRDAQVTLWSQGVFGLSHGTLESLSESVNSFDFAALVLTPDDLTISRETSKPSARDNVLMELGMFIGAIGRHRTFIVLERDKVIKIPTDLAGVTPATFAMHDNRNYQASLGPVCTQIKAAFRELGLRTGAAITGKIDQSTQFLIIADLLGNPANQFLIQMFELDSALVRRESHMVMSEHFEYALDDDRGGCGGFDLDQVCHKLPDADIIRIDLRGNVTLTERGKDYALWLIKNGRKAAYFWSKKGTWGQCPPWLEEAGRRGRMDQMNQVPYLTNRQSGFGGVNFG